MVAECFPMTPTKSVLICLHFYPWKEFIYDRNYDLHFPWSVAHHPQSGRASSSSRHFARQCLHPDAKQRLPNHLHRQANGGLPRQVHSVDGRAGIRLNKNEPMPYRHRLKGVISYTSAHKAYLTVGQQLRLWANQRHIRHYEARQKDGRKQSP